MKIDLDNCRKCIHSSVCTWYGAEYCDWYVNTCGDAISRTVLLEAIDTWDKFGYTETGCFVRLTKELDENYVGYVHLEDVINAILGLPSVTPQQRTGRWIDAEVLDKIRAEIDEEYDRVHPYDISCAEGLEMALEIIDKYKTEGSE